MVDYSKVKPHGTAELEISKEASQQVVDRAKDDPEYARQILEEIGYFKAMADQKAEEKDRKVCLNLVLKEISIYDYNREMLNNIYKIYLLNIKELYYRYKYGEHIGVYCLSLSNDLINYDHGLDSFFKLDDLTRESISNKIDVFKYIDSKLCYNYRLVAAIVFGVKHKKFELDNTDQIKEYLKSSKISFYSGQLDGAINIIKIYSLI